MIKTEATPPPPALEVESIRGGYGEADVLKGVSFTLSTGEFIGVIGPNGSGKSTMVRSVTHILPLRAGRVRILGRDVGKCDRRELARRVAVVPQRNYIPFQFTVEQVVWMGRTPHLGRLRPAQPHDRTAVDSAIEWADVAHLRGRFVDELSGGEFQRVVIARALAQEPKLLLLDEPTSQLDINHTADIFDLLRRLNQEQSLTVMCISHDLNTAALYAHRLLLMADGQVLADGPPSEIITEDNIRKAYGAKTIVRKSPAADRPQVSLVPHPQT